MADYTYRLTPKRINKTDISWAIMFSALFILSVWKLRYGYVIDDEAFYSSIPNRISFGDIFFKDEWHLSQLSGFLTLPFVSVYHALFHTNDGLLLYMRKCYLAVHTIVSAMIYLKLRGLSRESVSISSLMPGIRENREDHSPECSINSFMQISVALASGLFMLFAPGNIMALSYNTLGIDLLSMAGLFSACGMLRCSFIESFQINAEKNDIRKIKSIFFFSGLFFAGAVLCCPYLIGIYAVYIAAWLILMIYTKKGFARSRNNHALLIGQSVISFSAGAAVLAVLFFAFFLSRANLKDIFINLPYMLLDPEHQNTSLLYKLPRYFSAIFLHGVRQWRLVLPAYIIEMLVLAADKNRKNRRTLYFIISCIITIICLISVLPTLLSLDFTSMMFPMIFPAAIAYILTYHKPKALFFCIFLPGILYSVCVHLSSNQAFFVIAMAVSVSDIAGIIFIGIFLGELKDTCESSTSSIIKRSFKGCVCTVFLCLALQAGVQTYVRIQHTFRDEAPVNLSCEITEGPAKGIITTTENAVMYTMAYHDLEYYDDKPDGKILILVKEPWYYLETYGKECASYSAWIAEEDENTLHMLDLYYETNPEKRPDYIYISKYSPWNLEKIISTAEKAGYCVDQENELSVKLEKQQA